MKWKTSVLLSKSKSDQKEIGDIRPISWKWFWTMQTTRMVHQICQIPHTIRKAYIFTKENNNHLTTQRRNAMWRWIHGIAIPNKLGACAGAISTVVCEAFHFDDFSIVNFWAMMSTARNSIRTTVLACIIIYLFSLAASCIFALSFDCTVKSTPKSQQKHQNPCEPNAKIVPTLSLRLIGVE